MPRPLARQLHANDVRVFAWRGAAYLTLLAVTACAVPSPAIAPGPQTATTLDARLLQMVDQRRTDTLLVDAILADASPARRARAVLAVGNVRMRSRYAAVRRLLTDRDTLVAASAAYALGVARDTAGVAALTQAVERAGGTTVASEAAWALGEIGEPARASLLRLLGTDRMEAGTGEQHTAASPAVRSAVLLSTAKLRPVPVAVVVPFLSDGDPVVVRAAAYVIGRPRLAGGVRALAERRSSADEETRQHVARGLAKQAAGDSLASLARDALRALMRDDSPRVRANAARSIVSFGASAVRDVESALEDRDANVRVAASEGLQSVFLRDSTAWRRAWTRDTTFRVRQQLLMAARAAKSTALSEGEREWTTHADWRRRAAALDARAATGDDALAVARQFARDADVRVRAAALSVIPASVKDDVARTLIEPSLSHGDLALRAAALAVLIPRARAGDIATGLLALRRAEGDREGNARVNALRVIASAWRRDSARVDSATRRAMATLRTDASVSERRLVTSVTPLHAWVRAGVPTTARSLAEYERVVRRYQADGVRQPRAVIHTDRGKITMELFGADAPLVVEAFVRLASDGFYRNTVFHRVVPNFVVQDGDPRGDGSGGPGFALRDHHARRRHDRGALGLATSGPDTGGSQYYLCHSAQPHLDGGYTVFGRVIDGFEVMDAIVQGDRMLRIEITS